MTMPSILACSDMSTNVESTLEVALFLAAEMGAEVDLVHLAPRSADADEHSPTRGRAADRTPAVLAGMGSGMTYGSSQETVLNRERALRPALVIVRRDPATAGANDIELQRGSAPAEGQPGATTIRIEPARRTG
jgi:hypothetical protein